MNARDIAVLYGGASVEREVSLVSGRACAEALKSLGHRVRLVDVGRDVESLLAGLRPRPEIVFNALHGRWGEDGCVQGLLNLLGIPYTHSGLLASALAMDKPMAKKLFAAAGLTCPDGEVVGRKQILAGDVMEPPYVVKPLHEGSSVGVTIVRPGDNDRPFAAGDWPFGDQVLLERYIPGRELTVAVMGDRPLAVTELRPTQGFYDYDAKYVAGRTEHLVPAPVPKPVYETAMESALQAHRVLGCRGVSRADFRYDDRPDSETADGLYLLEVNTQPGMTPLSLVPEQAAHVDIDFPELVQWMVEAAACD